MSRLTVVFFLEVSLSIKTLFFSRFDIIENLSKYAETVAWNNGKRNAEEICLDRFI